MNNDIRISCSFPEHYKTKKLIAIAGSSAPFSLVCLWIYAARNKPDGFLDNMDNFDIEIASNWNGEPGKFFEAIIKCRFLIEADEGFFIKDWQEHQPYASGAEERSAKARFSILARHNKDLHAKLKAQGVDSLTVEEYKTYTKRIPTVKQSYTKSYDFLTPSPSPSPEPSPEPSKKINNPPAKKSPGKIIEIPENLSTPDFLETWENWKAFRLEIKRPLKPTTQEQQLKRFAKEGVERSIEAIQNSIENGWQGLFWDKVKASGTKRHPMLEALDRWDEIEPGPSNETLGKWEEEAQREEARNASFNFGDNKRNT